MKQSRIRWARGLACALFAAGLVPARAAQTFDVEIPRQKRETFDQAAFHLWLPDNAPPVRGIAVALDGINVDGRHLAGRPQWQDFARRNSLALVSCYFATTNLEETTYCRAEYGSGRALLAGLAELGRRSGHPEFEKVPLFLLGFSAGGQFSYSFACFAPERVAAFCVNKGGVFDTKATAAARLVPGLFIAGAADTGSRRSAMRALYLENRQLGARWCLANEPKRGHQTGNANDLALPFFEAVMRRWDGPGSARDGVVLDLERQRLIAPGPPPKDARLTFWFPDESVVATWSTFSTVAR